MITGRRRRNAQTCLSPFLKLGESFQLGIQVHSDSDPILSRVGFNLPVAIGNTMLPLDSLGKISSKNANGSYGPAKRNLPKESFTVSFMSTSPDWHGNLHTSLKTRTGTRYQRDFFPPYAMELSLYNSISGGVHLITESMIFGADSSKEIHAINLLLELFGHCEVYDKNGGKIINAPSIKVNWRLLPPGSITWTQVSSSVNHILTRIPRQYRQITDDRIKFIVNHSPSQFAYGDGGFSDYLAFHFPAKNHWILESVKPDNASYVLPGSWLHVSQLTKSQILQGNLATARVFHSESWETNIMRYIK